MYPQHFGLDRRLFAGGIAQDDAMFVGDLQRSATEHMSVALAAADSAVVLHGPPGVGKTTLAAHAMRSSSASMRIASAWLGSAPATAAELLELLLNEFGFDPYKHSRIERLQTWRGFLTELGATETRVFIAVERCEALDVSVLQGLDSLTTSDPNGCPGANLILMGGEELVRRLDQPVLAALRQRVRLVKRFEPLDDEGVEAYLRHCAAGAGAELEALLAPDALDPLRAFTGGVPRLLNNLCDTALALAAARGEPRVTAALVTHAAVDLHGLAPLGAAGPAAAAPDDDRPAESAEERSRSSPAQTNLYADSSEAPADDNIPVLTESVDVDDDVDDYPDVDADADVEEPAIESGGPNEAEGYELDPAATMTLLDDSLDDLSAELAAAILAGDDEDWADTAAEPSEPDRLGKGRDTDDTRFPPLRARA